MKTQLIFSASNPVISSHRVNGQMILPGLAYIDLILQHFRKSGLRYNELEIKKLTIQNPLIVEDGGKVIVTVASSETSLGAWKVNIDGRNSYAQAEVVQAGKFFAGDTPDVSSLKKNAIKSYPIADVYKRCEGRGLKHTGFMRAEGNIYTLEQDMLFEAGLGAEAKSTAEQFMFHPALIDGSALATMQLFDDLVKEEDSLFLPVYIESFRADAFINQQCITYAPVSSVKRQNEVISLSLYFLDETGKKIGELTRLTAKLVRKTVTENSDIKLQKAQKIIVSDDEGEVVVFLKQVIAGHLNLNPNYIDASLPYYNMGFDSMSLLQLAEVISTKIGVDLPPTLLFEYANINLLADHLSDAYANKFSSFKVIEHE